MTNEILISVIAVLWAGNLLLGSILGYFIKRWIQEIKSELDKKTDSKQCKLFHDIINARIHTHAKSGQAGEVIAR